MGHRAILMLAVLLVAVGCVDRRYVVRVNDARNPGVSVPAQVSVDGTPLGNAPLDARYIYTGKYEFRAVAEGYQPLVKIVRFKPKWYDYPGLDLFAEVFWPFRIEDVRVVNLELEPARPLKPHELQANADALREKGMALPPSQIPDPRQQPQPQPLTGQPRSRGQ